MNNLTVSFTIDFFFLLVLAMQPLCELTNVFMCKPVHGQNSIHSFLCF